MWIKDLCLKHNVHFLGIQESKMTRLELFRIKSMWGNYAFDYACSMARGLSGGLISIWDPNMFSKNSIWCDDSFIIIKGNWFSRFPIGGFALLLGMNKAGYGLIINPFLLHIDKTDFGPTPFKLYNSWLLRDGFDNLIKEEWELLDSNLKCHEKFRRLKDKIKQWSNNIKTFTLGKLRKPFWDWEVVKAPKARFHNAFEDLAVGNGFVTVVNIKNSTINVSHLFYADDVIITTDWNAKDMDNIIRVLHVFYLASGLKINIHKSNIYGIGWFIMSLCNLLAGTDACDSFHMWAFSWKANLLSIGGRLTLIKSVLGSLGIYYLSIFRAPESVLQDLERFG
ncbi:hypothetical protein Tco_0474439 [Tanacetum coccineum]